MTAKETERQQTIRALKKMIRPGATIYCTLKHCSRSGMYRVIDLFLMKRNTPLCISQDVAQALGEKYDIRHEGVGVGGCGMDMGFHLVYSLGRALFPKGGSLEHSPRRSQEERLGETKETDGGYLLRKQPLGLPLWM